MIIATCIYPIKQGTMEAVLELSAGIRAFARSLPGNIEYAPAAYPYAENTVYSVEKWESIEAMAQYCNSEECKAFQSKRNQYLSCAFNEIDAHVYETEEIDLSKVMVR